MYPCFKCSLYAVSLLLVTIMPEEYPNVVPTLSIETIKGLTISQRDEILDVANKSAQDNLGMPSIYMVTEAVREWLLDNNVPGQDGSMYAEMMRKAQQKELEAKKREERAALASQADREKSAEEMTPEEKERLRRRQAGTPVTVESFKVWKAGFDAERKLAEAASRGPREDEADLSRPTGKQLFLSNLAGREDEEETETSDNVFSFRAEGEEEVDDDDDDDDDSDYEDGEEEYSDDDAGDG